MAAFVGATGIVPLLWKATLGLREDGAPPNTVVSRDTSDAIETQNRL